VLSVAVNGGGRPRAYRGWPLLVRARLLHPNAYARDGKVEPLVLAAAAGPWSAAVRLEVHDQRGEALRWPFHLVAQGAPALALDAQTGGDLTWYLAPEETAALPAGDCTLVARLDTRDSAAPGGWKGARSSETVRLAVGEGPAALSPEQEATKYVLLAEYARLRGDPKQALAHVEDLLSKQPGSIAGLTVKADLLADTGRHLEALAACNKAIDAFHARYPKSREPPHGLLLRRRALFAQVSRDRPKRD
jgi:tetratricopeptide (TPR) repeat protein